MTVRTKDGEGPGIRIRRSPAYKFEKKALDMPPRITHLYAFGKLNIGDAVEIDTRKVRKTYGQIYKAAYDFGKRQDPPRAFQVRTMKDKPNFVKVWRDK